MSYKNEHMEIFFHLTELAENERKLCFICAVKAVNNQYYKTELALTATNEPVKCSKCEKEIR